MERGSFSLRELRQLQRHDDVKGENHRFLFGDYFGPLMPFILFHIYHVYTQCEQGIFCHLANIMYSKQAGMAA